MKGYGKDTRSSRPEPDRPAAPLFPPPAIQRKPEMTKGDVSLSLYAPPPDDKESDIEGINAYWNTREVVHAIATGKIDYVLRGLRDEFEARELKAGTRGGG